MTETARSRTWIVAAAVAALSTAPGAARGETRFRAPWACSEVDVEEAEALRGIYLETLRQAALELLAESEVEVGRYLGLYERDPYELEPGDPAMQSARLQRESFREALEARRRLRAEADFYETASTHAYHAQMGIDGVLGWSASYPEEAAAQVVETLESLEPYGFVVVRDGRTLGGEPVDLRDGRYYVDWDADLMPYLRSAPESACRRSSRLAQVEDTVRRDAARVEALLAWAELPIPVLDVDVPGEGLREHLFRPTVAEVIESDAPIEDYWLAMWRALDEIRDNIVEERFRLREAAEGELYDLSESPLLRTEALGRRSDLDGIDCIVSSELGLDDIGFAAASGVASLVGIGLALTGHPYLAYALYATAMALGAVDTAQRYAAYRQAERSYLTSVEGYGLLPREIVEGRRRGFLLALAGTLVDAVVTVRQGWILYRLALRSPGRMGVLASSLDDGVLRQLDDDEIARLLGAGFEDDRVVLEELLERVRAGATIPAEVSEEARRIVSAYPDAEPFHFSTNRYTGDVATLRYGAEEWPWERIVREARLRLGPGHAGELGPLTRLEMEEAVRRFGRELDYDLVIMPNGRVRYVSAELEVNLGSTVFDMHELTRGDRIIGFADLRVGEGGVWTLVEDYAVMPEHAFGIGARFPAGRLRYPTLMELASPHGVEWDIEETVLGWAFRQ